MYGEYINLSMLKNKPGKILKLGKNQTQVYNRFVKPYTEIYRWKIIFKLCQIQ